MEVPRGWRKFTSVRACARDGARRRYAGEEDEQAAGQEDAGGGETWACTSPSRSRSGATSAASWPAASNKAPTRPSTAGGERSRSQTTIALRAVQAVGQGPGERAHQERGQDLGHRDPRDVARRSGQHADPDRQGHLDHRVAEL